MEVGALYSNFAVNQPVISAPQSAVENSADTILPQGSQSVAPVGAGEASGSSAAQSQADQGLPTPTVARFTRDSSTNTLVFMEVDPQTQAVIVQFPDEQLLKLKSYIAEMQRREQVAYQSIPGTVIAKTT